MWNAEAEKVRVGLENPAFEDLLEELWRLHKTLPLENYFFMIEEFVEEAKHSLDALQDKETREHLREQYRRVIEFAVDLACCPSA